MLGFVARDQHAVLGGHKVGFDEVGSQFDGLFVTFQRVVGQVAAGTAVTQYQGLLAGEGGVAAVAAASGQGSGCSQGQQAQLCFQCAHCFNLLR
jgi:hypothetical protein